MKSLAICGTRFVWRWLSAVRCLRMLSHSMFKVCDLCDVRRLLFICLSVCWFASQYSCLLYRLPPHLFLSANSHHGARQLFNFSQLLFFLVPVYMDDADLRVGQIGRPPVDSCLCSLPFSYSLTTRADLHAVNANYCKFVHTSTLSVSRTTYRV